MSSAGVNSYAAATPEMKFKDTPIYTILRAVGEPMVVKTLPHSNTTVQYSLPLSLAHAQELSKPHIALMLYSENGTRCHGSNHYMNVFPSNVRLEINGIAYSKNLRPIKKADGTVNPADITKLVRAQHGYQNRISITYSQTLDPFVLQAFMVFVKDIDDLVSEVKNGAHITKDQTLKTIRAKAVEDDEIEALSFDLSLADPATGMRIQLPVKTVACDHIQCFDAKTFFQLQEQAPQWQCSIGSCRARVTTLKNLVIDDYMVDLLNKTDGDLKSVTISPEGVPVIKQKQPVQSSSKKQKMAVHHLIDSDDEDGGIALFHKDKGKGPAFKQEDSFVKATFAPSPTPAGLSSDTSSAALVSNPSLKRKAPPEVVDLLSSSDEDDDPVRPMIPIKRSSTFGTIGLASPAKPPAVEKVASSSASGMGLFANPGSFGDTAWKFPGSNNSDYGRGI